MAKRVNFAERLGEDVRSLERNIVIKTNREIKQAESYRDGYIQALEDMYEAAVLANGGRS